MIHNYGGHKIDFLELNPKLNSPQKITNFLFERIQTQPCVMLYEEGLLVFAFTFKGSAKVHYLGVYIDGSNNANYGRLHTAFPITYHRNAELYKFVENYFGSNNNLIEEGIEID
ncbi:MAG: hypothetical protein EU548_01300 [Promethearchaeota archaeon]|nr:MAG: hypothetical protein EU548_01300 [Candidatus Lokiarchaeota archaeon]